MSALLWVRVKVTKFGTMPTAWQLSALLNLLLDAFLFAFLIGMVFIGMTRDPNAFIIWVPLLAVACWFQFKQAGRRWSL